MLHQKFKEQCHQRHAYNKNTESAKRKAIQNVTNINLETNGHIFKRHASKCYRLSTTEAKIPG